MATHVEIEAKYDLAPGDPLPDLVGTGGVSHVEVRPEQELVAVYHDTEDLRLTAAGTTLRRRTGGDDDGWHLKLPLGPGRRLEVRRPLGREGSPVPKALADLVRAPIGGRRLVPVATLTTTRRVLRLCGRDGVIVAELADDTVRAQRHGSEPALTTWRELEVELIDGSPEQLAALDEAVRAAGVEPATAGSKVGRVLEAEAPRARPAPRRKAPLVELLAAHAEGLLHAHRVADQRVRAGVEGGVAELAAVTRGWLGTLAAYRHRMDPSARTDLQDVAGRLRDLRRLLESELAADAAAETIRSAVAGEPAELVLGPVRRTVDRYATARRRTARALLLAELRSAAYVSLLDDLETLAENPPLADPAERGRQAVSDVVRRARKAVNRRVGEVDPTGGALPPDVADAVDRLAASLASGAPALGKQAGDLAAVVDELGRLAGDVERTAAVRADLRQLAVQAHASGGNGFTFGRVHARQEASAERSIRALRKAGKQLRRTPVGWLD